MGKRYASWQATLIRIKNQLSTFQTLSSQLSYQARLWDHLNAGCMDLILEPPRPMLSTYTACDSKHLLMLLARVAL
jgi:hypothetical protein